MSHYDADTLALIALGEQEVSSDSGAHLAQCEQCRDEVASLRNVVVVGRSTAPTDTLLEPPARVWEGIVQATGVGEATAQPPTQSPSVVTPTNVVPLAKKSRRSSVLLGVAAGIVGLVVGVGITVAAESTTTTKPTVVASVPLQPKSVADAQGTAVISYNKGKPPVVTISVRNLPQAHGYYEVWLMNAAPLRFVALGPLNANQRGVFQLPAGLPVRDYGYIDISLQPYNGSPVHSGNSVARGALPASFTHA